MEVISVIVMFIFGNMNDQEHRMTQYVPMESLSSCMKEVRILKKKETDYTKDAFCGPALVELSDDGEILTLHTELPEGAKMVKKEISKEAFKRWTLRSKEKWNNKFFLHVSALEEAGIETLQEGEAVSFDIGENRGKENAINVKKVS
jgi:cold shock CspA family protein